MKSRFPALTVLLVSALILSACANTVRGVGRDVEQTGDAIEDATD